MKQNTRILYNMVDCLIPIGDNCNITFLLQNAKLKTNEFV
jgi:hypothetical protein